MHIQSRGGLQSTIFYSKLCSGLFLLSIALNYGTMVFVFRCLVGAVVGFWASYRAGWRSNGETLLNDDYFCSVFRNIADRLDFVMITFYALKMISSQKNSP